MAWRSSGSTHIELITNLKKNNLIKSTKVFDAMAMIDRGDFTNQEPYTDSPKCIGYRATISAPHMHAIALEQLKDHLNCGDRALDVGCGSGYITACMAVMVGDTGKVVGIDHIPELIKLAENNVLRSKPEFCNSRLKFVVGDGRLGYPEEAPYNAIHVGATSDELPKMLIDQLKVGGRMVIPIGRTYGDQYLEVVDKLPNGDIERQKLMGVVYVRLTDKDKQV